MSTNPVIQRLQQAETRQQTLSRANFEEAAHAGGSGETTILTHKASQPLALRNGARYRLVPIVRESFTTDGTNGNTETVNLSHDLIDADVTNPNVVAYVDGSETAVSNTDYANDTVDVGDLGNTNTDGTIYYVTGTQASVKVKKVAPGGSASETLVRHDSALINRREPNRDPLRFDLTASPVQATVPKNWTLEVTIDGAYNSGRYPSSDPEPSNFLLEVPINRAQQREVDGLDRLVRQDVSQRV